MINSDIPGTPLLSCRFSLSLGENSKWISNLIYTLVSKLFTKWKPLCFAFISDSHFLFPKNLFLKRYHIIIKENFQNKEEQSNIWLWISAYSIPEYDPMHPCLDSCTIYTTLICFSHHKDFSGFLHSFHMSSSFHYSSFFREPFTS